MQVGAAWAYWVYQAVLIITFVITGSIAVIGARRRSVPRAAALAFLMAAIAEWSLFYSLEMVLPGLASKLLLAKLEYLGIVVVPLAWLVTALEFSGHDLRLSRRWLVVLSVMPLVTLVLTWTNELHRLVWAQTGLAIEGPFWVLSTVHGPAFWLHTIYSYALLAAGSYYLIREFVRRRQLYRRQALGLLLGVVAPWLGNALFLSGQSPFGGLDLTPIAFLFTGVSLAWNVFSQRFLDIVPVAHHAVFANLGDPVIVLNSASKVVDLNPAAKELIGKADSEVIGRPAIEVFHDQVDLVRRFENVMSAEAEVTVHSRKGIRVFDIRISPLLVGDGHLTGRLIALRDITERHTTEEAIRLALTQERELSDLKSRFISMTSHEFRTPLSAIFSSAELLEYYGARWDDAKKLRHLHQIQSAARHMAQLLEDVLTIGKAEASKLECRPAPLELEPFCWGLVEEMQRVASPGQNIEFAGQGLERAVCLDEKLLRQILTNLLSNAIKYSPQGSPVHFSVIRDGAQVVLSVADHGIGIPADDQPRLFETFHRAANVGTIPGTGLGMAILKKAVDLHGGRVEFVSTAGEGTTFTVTLPSIYPREAPDPSLAVCD